MHLGYSVFISHSSKDADLAKELCRLLEAESISCWIAPRDIVAGASYGEVIARAIEHVTVIVLLLTESANASRAVANELELGFRYQRTIVPIRVDHIHPSKQIEFFVSNAQWVDAITSPLKKRVVEVVNIVQAIEKGLDVPVPKAEENTWLSRVDRLLERMVIYKYLTMGLVLIFTLIGLGVIYYSASTSQKILENEQALIQQDPSTFGLVNLHPSEIKGEGLGLRSTVYVNLHSPAKLGVKFLAMAQNTKGDRTPIQLNTDAPMAGSDDLRIFEIRAPQDTNRLIVCIQATHPDRKIPYEASWMFNLYSKTEGLQISRAGDASLHPLPPSNCE